MTLLSFNFQAEILTCATPDKLLTFPPASAVKCNKCQLANVSMLRA